MLLHRAPEIMTSKPFAAGKMLCNGKNKSDAICWSSPRKRIASENWFYPLMSEFKFPVPECGDASTPRTK